MQVIYEPNRLSKLNLSDAYEKVVEITSRKLKNIEKDSTSKKEIQKKIGGNTK